MNPTPARKGFSLIELLVVVAIIIILLALLMPALNGAMEQARLVQCSANLKAIQTATMAFADANEGLMVPIDVRPWDFSAATRAQMQEIRTQRWWHRWSSILMKEGFLDLVPMVSPTVGWPLSGSDNPNADPMPPKGRSVFLCPSAKYEYAGAGLEGGANHWNPISFMADKNIYAMNDLPHGPTELGSPVVYASYPVHYGISASNASSAYASERSPSGGVPRWVHTGTYSNPTSLIVYYDGRFMHNRTSIGRINARHLNQTAANFSFADGHVAAFRVADLPALNNSDASLYPSWRR